MARDDEPKSRKEKPAQGKRRARKTRGRPERPRQTVFDGDDLVEGFDDLDFEEEGFPEETGRREAFDETRGATPSEREPASSFFEQEAEGPAVPEPVVVDKAHPIERELRADEREPGPERRPARDHVRRVRRSEPGNEFSFVMPLIILAALATLIVSILFTRLGSIDYSNLAFFLVVFTVAAFFRLQLKGGGEISLGYAPLLAALIALPVGMHVIHYDKITAAGCVQVVWMFLIGSLIVFVATNMTGLSKEDVLSLLLDYSGVGLITLVFFLLIRILPKKPEFHGSYTPAVLGAAVVCAALLYLVYVARESFVLSSEGHFPTGVYFQSILRKSWLPFSIIAFSGGLMGLIFVGIGMWSLIIVLPVLLIFMYAYNRVAATDQYLLETIRVLSAIPEETGMLTVGHADRVAQLSVGVARELGLSPEDSQQVQFAAYLHDIGAVTRQGMDAEQRQLTETEGVISGGVDIVGKVDYLDVAAEILGGREGLRDRVSDVDKRRAVSLGSGILRAVDDFEGLVAGSEAREPLSESDALTEMNLERGVKYDSKVLRAISRVLPRLPRELSSSAEGSFESSPFWGDQEG
ncbi:MAG TPA: HD domain-containing phosphohydrolase [Candidatus Anoxymicrobiaceae bacterium]